MKNSVDYLEIKCQTFIKLIQILQITEENTKSRGGKPNASSIKDLLLITFEYLREYRTYFHVEASYELSESACYQNICCKQN